MNRLVVVGVAALVALGSGVGLLRYVGTAEDRAAESVDAAPVLMATAALPDGTSFDEAWADGTIVVGQTIRSSLPETAVADPATLTGMVADGDLLEGQIVVTGAFVDPQDSGRRPGPPSFADDLPEGTVAVSFDASGAAAVSDLIRPGDRVNLLVQVPNASVLGLPDSSGPAVVHIFQDLQVIAIGAAVLPVVGAEEEDEAAAAPAGGSYTVAVAPKDAARLLLLTRQFEVFLALVGPGTEPSTQGPVGSLDALPDTLTAEDAVPRADP